MFVAFIDVCSFSCQINLTQDNMKEASWNLIKMNNERGKRYG